MFDLFAKVVIDSDNITVFSLFDDTYSYYARRSVIIIVVIITESGRISETGRVTESPCCAVSWHDSATRLTVTRCQRATRLYFCSSVCLSVCVRV